MKKQISLEATIQKIIFKSDDTGYAVCVCKTKKDNKKFTALGTLSFLNEKDDVTLIGEIVYHEKYGEQLKVSSVSFQTISVEEIEYELKEVKGIGNVKAQRLVSEFGISFMDIIQTQPVRLLSVKGITESDIINIRNEMKSLSGETRFKVAMAKLGISLAYYNRIIEIEKDPAKALLQIERDPFWLMRKINGYGFKKADVVRENLQISSDSPLRLRALVSYVIQNNETNGNCYITMDQLEGQMTKLLTADGVDDSKIIEAAIHGALVNNDIYIEDDKVYSSQTYKCEEFVSKYLAECANNAREAKFNSGQDTEILLERIKEIADKKNITLHEKQIEAIVQSFFSPFSIITGGPGTGKTTILNIVAELYRQNGLVAYIQHRKEDAKGINEGPALMLAAPTGKAAQRLKESTGMETYTIHRLLEYSPQEGFKRNGRKKLPDGVMIIDETSMLDIHLAKALFEGCNPDTNIIFVGDANQLPSVDAGNVLHDIISSDLFPVTKLSHIYRQKDADGNVLKDIALNIAEENFSNISLKPANDFLFVEAEGKTDELTGDNQIVDSIISYIVHEKIPASKLLVLSPWRSNGDVSVEKLNKVLQNVYNAEGEVVPFTVNRSRGQYRVGDKVMQTVNNYDKNVLNGDCGVIYECNKEFAYVKFEGKKETIKYKKDEIGELDLGYATTIHKSQGSEAENVMIVCARQHSYSLDRELIYTGITRAKSKAYIFGDKKTFFCALHNKRQSQRQTSLCERMNKMIDFENMHKCSFGYR